VAATGGGIVGLATVTAVFSVVGGVVLATVGRREHPGLLAVRAARWSTSTWRRLRAFSAHPFFYALATFAIVNLDAVFVARWDYGRLVPTSSAAPWWRHSAPPTSPPSALLPVVAEVSAGPFVDAAGDRPAFTERRRVVQVGRLVRQALGAGVGFDPLLVVQSRCAGSGSDARGDGRKTRRLDHTRPR